MGPGTTSHRGTGTSIAVLHDGREDSSAAEGPNLSSPPGGWASAGAFTCIAALRRGQTTSLRFQRRRCRIWSNECCIAEHHESRVGKRGVWIVDVRHASATFECACRARRGFARPSTFTRVSSKQRARRGFARPSTFTRVSSKQHGGKASTAAYCPAAGEHVRLLKPTGGHARHGSGIRAW